MGCDIHMILQRRVNDEWLTVLTDIYPDRYYALFGILSNVRVESPLRKSVLIPGLPEDFKIDDDHSIQWSGHFGNDDGFYWMGDHSYGWTDLERLEKFYCKDSSLTDHKKEDAHVLLNKFIWSIVNLTGGYEPHNYRIVAGYDN